MNEILNETRNPHDIASRLGIPVSKAREMVSSCTEELEGWGPVKKQKNIISRRHVWATWPNAHKERIQHHQKLHDQGRVSMCQGRDGSYFILYAMPHRKVVQRNAYFFVDRGY